MRTDPQGSYASHIAHSQAHNGRAVCHDFRPSDGWHRDRTAWPWRIAFAMCVGAILLALAWPR